MAKFGKKYKFLQIQEWKSHYFDYKKLKQEIKSIKEKINKDISNGTIYNINISMMPSLDVIPIESRRATFNMNDLTILYTRKYGKDLEEFVKILNDELNKYYSFYILLEKELYQKVNNHLYTQTNYQNYNLNEVYDEMNKLNKTAFLVKCLNSFSYDNLNALKNILKKFDNKLGNYCGKIEFLYISYQLSLKADNKLKYLLQSKILDEATTICESNLKELFKYYSQNQNKLEYIPPNIDNNINNKAKQNNEINTNLKNINKKKDIIDLPFQDLNQNNIKLKIPQVRQEILNSLREADTLTYFKIQYGDWFYFLEEEECPLRQREKLLENSIFNPVLSSTYRKDNIISKFISNKECLKEVKKNQNKISLKNKINIIYIFIHSFFYNSLFTCIYPLLFIYIKGKDYEHIYGFLSIAMTYFTYSLFMIICHNTKLDYIKMINTISYIFCIIGNLCYIYSYYINTIDNDYIFFSLILSSRIFIGLGNNIMVGKKYITLYIPRFFFGKISLIYLLFQNLGFAFGPLIGIGLLYIPKKELFWNLEYNYYNCVGWYGFIGGFFLLLLNLILFTSPGKDNLIDFRNQYNPLKNSNFNEDMDDSLDKEYYDMKKELINSQIDNNSEFVIEGNEDSITKKSGKSDNIMCELKQKQKFSSRDNPVSKSKRLNLNSQKNLLIYKNIGSLDVIKKQNTDNLKLRNLSENENDLNSLISADNINLSIKGNPLSNTTQNDKEQNDESDLIYTDFNKINMIPRTLDDIIRKEKRTFGYINHNLLIMFLLLFFNNFIKENYIAFVSYYITMNETFSKAEKNNNKEEEIINLDVGKVKLTCLFTGLTYLSELFSLFFIFPFYKINVLFKKYAIILMTLTIILMLALSFFLYLKIDYPYFIILFFLILINMTLEVISSSYLTYLLPPSWKFKHIRAAALTVYIMVFGKIFGILFCLISYADTTWDYFGITIIVSIFYTGMIIYLCKSKNLGIKAICRIIQIKNLEELIL